MASQVPAKKGAAFTLYFSLYKSDGTIIANPGTYTKRVSKDGGASADTTNSVTEIDTTYGMLSLTLSTTEMNADAVQVYVADNTTGCVPFTATIYTAAATLDEGVAVASIAANAITASALATDAGTEIADAMLKRDLDQVEGSAPVHSIAHVGLQLTAGCGDDDAGYMVTYKTDGTTPFAKRAITTDAGKLPIDSLGTSVAP